MTVQVRYVKLVPNAEAPKFGTAGSAGADLTSVETVALNPGERRLIRTGLSVEIPKGYEMQIRPRSGMAYNDGVTVLNSPGTIDSDYRGEVKVLLINLGQEPVILHKGTRIAQAVVAPVEPVAYAEATELGVTARGEGGFGSTGT